jgi:hypothetical protein
MEALYALAHDLPLTESLGFSEREIDKWLRILTYALGTVLCGSGCS